ncbi:MAG: GNAT family N-acetyltransferase [Acidiferrobacterales bacterium]
MTGIGLPYRAATPGDARELARLVNIAGEGLPLYLWKQMAGEGESAWEVGRARAQREDGGFSYQNAVLRVRGEKVVACLVGYPLASELPGTDYSEIPPMFVPLQQLEDMVPGTWYINVVAVYEEFRGRGYGKELLALAETIARDLGMRGLSLIVADTNEGARKLYNKIGFQEKAYRSMVKERWQHPGANWVLMVKNLEYSH